MLGEVEVPGGYVFHGNTNIMLALYLANGPSPLGSVRHIQLVRDGKSSEIDLYEYLFKEESASVLAEGRRCCRGWVMSVVFLPRAPELLVQVDGDVGRPATYELKKGEGVRELIGYASGLNPTLPAKSAGP